MVVDVGIVRKHIKPKADSTLRNMRKEVLIEYIRTLEHNYNVAVSFNENQAKYIESLNIGEVRYGQMEEIEPCNIRVDRQCCLCGTAMGREDNYCPNCGAKMVDKKK